MESFVEKQVERILDEDQSRVHSVIVQMEDTSQDLQPILEASTQALHRRHLTTSPRELAPPRAELVRKLQELSSHDRRKLRETASSMTSQFALAAVEGIAMEALRSAGLSALEPLMTSDVVKEAIISTIRRSKKKSQKKGGAPGFKKSWSSRSAVLKVTRDELSDLSKTVPNISGIYLNGQVTLPPVVEVQDLPQSIQENSTSSWGVEKIGALSVWGAHGSRGKPVHGGKPIKVAVLDTGADPSHPELKGKIQDWAEFDEDGAPVGSQPHDSGQHGTHVCGTIAGGRSGESAGDHPLIGVAPDVKLMAGLVLKGGSGTYFQILSGIDWAIDNGADVINMSLGGVGFEPDVVDIYTRSILNANRLGIPVVISIGNEGAQTSGAPGNDYFAFSIGATDHLDRPGGFSGGRTQIIRESRYIKDEYLPLIYSKPEVTAPGVAVRSCIPNEKYGTWNGTSMAAPHVSGAIALLLANTDIKSLAPERRAIVLQDLITSSVEELGEAGRDHRYGFGRINVLRAIAFAKERGY